MNLSGKSIALMTIANRTGGRVAVGATAAFSGKTMTRGPITVGLEPCGAAGARMVDSEGKPLTGYRDRDFIIEMIVTPGLPPSRVKDKAGRFFADARDLNRVDPVNYESGPVSDAEGRLTLPVLIPGATYRFIDYTTVRSGSEPQIRKEFTVKPSETLDLGDILIEKPQTP